VSALPVVDDRGHVLGVVSEADLLRKREQPGRPLVQLLSAPRRRQEWAKAQATVAAKELHGEIVDGVVQVETGSATTSMTCPHHDQRPSPTPEHEARTRPASAGGAAQCTRRSAITM
jgi:CBS domain